MQHTLLIVGTDHRFQMGSSDFTDDQHIAFINFIQTEAVQHKASAICEENNIQALQEHSLTESTLEPLARQLGLAHKHCDPSHSERQVLGIRQENTIRLQGLLSKHLTTEEEVAKLLSKSHKLRETYWIQQIKELDKWPVLFVCGANHVTSLVELAQNNDLRPLILASDWCT